MKFFSIVRRDGTKCIINIDNVVAFEEAEGGIEIQCLSGISYFATAADLTIVSKIVSVLSMRDLGG